MTTRQQGTLQRWNTDRAFGFIRPDRDCDEDVFVHVTAFPRGAIPEAGMRVEFETAENHGRIKAVDVRVMAARET